MIGLKEKDRNPRTLLIINCTHKTHTVAVIHKVRGRNMELNSSRSTQGSQSTISAHSGKMKCCVQQPHKLFSFLSFTRGKNLKQCVETWGMKHTRTQNTQKQTPQLHTETRWLKHTHNISHEQFHKTTYINTQLLRLPTHRQALVRTHTCAPNTDVHVCSERLHFSH